MMGIMRRILTVIVVLLVSGSLLCAQEGPPGGMPPARVVVGEVSVTMMAPEAEFVGTVYYKEVSEVAAEVEGKVEAVFFEEGQRVSREQELVRLDAELLAKSLISTQANYEQIQTEIEKAKLDLKRTEKLYKEKSVSEQVYDDARYAVRVLEKQAWSLSALVDRLKTELEKKRIKAPFNGVVIEKQTERGEWLAAGDTVGTIAREDVMDIIVNVPERILPFIQSDMEVSAVMNGTSVTGTVVTVVPRGNIATRTFPVKVRVEHTAGLMEGMEARVSLPIGKKERCLVVPRDAVIAQFGQNVVFEVKDSVAVMHRVRVCSFAGLLARVEAEELKEGMKVVIKGNERLQPGQPVEIVGASP